MSKLEEALKHHQRGHFEEAEKIYLEILQSQPDHPDALHLLGVIAAQRAQPGKAVELIERAIRVDSTVAAYHRNLGGALRAQGQIDAAIDALSQSLAIEFDGDTLDSLAQTLFAHRPPEQAVECYVRALSLWPNDARARRGLVSLLRTVRPTDSWPELEQELVECFRFDDIVHQHLAGVTANQLKHRYAFLEGLPLTDTERDAFLDTLSRDHLMLSLLVKTVNVDFEVERFLTDLRRHFLLTLDEMLRIPNEYAELLAALAWQCFNNEFVFSMDAVETRAVERLTSSLCGNLGESEQSSRADRESQVLVLACYVPLVSLGCARELAASNTTRWSPKSQALLAHALIEPLEERTIEGEIESLGTIGDPTSTAVRAQYEESPYPRWLNVGKSEENDLIATLRERFPHFTPPEFLTRGARILIAGCGTGEEAIRFAIANPDSEVLAVDLSRRSLAYAVRMARKLGADNVRFLQCDILELENLGERFHVVSSVGVLHHLADPLAGWRVLTDRLAPSGVMRVALYSERARRPFTVAREEIARRGFRPIAEDIKKFRSLVLSGAMNGGLAELLSGREFYSLSDCRDLLFHVEEHRFTPTQISEALTAMGLDLIGFDLSHLSVPQSFHEASRYGREMVDFAACERIEELYPRAFLSMYRFWCQKS